MRLFIFDYLIITQGFFRHDQGGFDLIGCFDSRRIPALTRNIVLAVKGCGRRMGEFFQKLLQPVLDVRFERARPSSNTDFSGNDIQESGVSTGDIDDADNALFEWIGLTALVKCAATIVALLPLGCITTCPPFPRKVILNSLLAAIVGPARRLIWPASIPGMLCSLYIASQENFSNRPSSIINLAPTPPSLAGWKMK